MNLKRNITFQLESRKKDGVLVTENVPIRMRVVFDGKRIEFTTGYRIDAAKWDASKQRVKNGCNNKLKQTSSEINADLNRYEGEIQNIFKEFELREIMPHPEQVKEQFNARIAVLRPEASTQEAEPQKTFWDMYDEFTSEVGRKNDWTTATYEKIFSIEKSSFEIQKR